MLIGRIYFAPLRLSTELTSYNTSLTKQNFSSDTVSLNVV